ncbi:MAG: hypothetical protein WA160_03690 [Pseudobdellovibrio sp.]
MKIHGLFFLINCLALVFFSTKTSAVEDLASLKNNQWTAEDFKSLSEANKKKFIHDLREVIVLLDEKSDYFAQILPQTNSLIGFAQAVLVQKCLANDEIEDPNKGVIKVYSAETYKKASQMALENFIKVNSSKSKKLSEAESRSAREALDLLVAEARHLKASPSEASKRALSVQFDETEKILSNYSFSDQTMQTMTGVKSTFNKLMSRVDKKIVLKENKTEKTDSSSAKKNNYEFSACLYAGFVIKEKVCKAPQTLPNDDLLNSLFNETNFKCGKSEVICNPLLFGYEGSCETKLQAPPKTPEELAKAMSKNGLMDPMITKFNDIQKQEKEKNECLKTVKPVCASNSVSVTSSCKQKTDNGTYLSKAVSIILANPKLIEEYVKNIHQLCDESSLTKNRLIFKKANGELRKNSEAIKNDITKTCAVALPKLTTVLAEYRSLNKGFDKTSLPIGADVKNTN